MIVKQELYIIRRTVCNTTNCFIMGILKKQGELRMPRFKEYVVTVCAAL
jgi:hypothetical protein